MRREGLCELPALSNEVSGAWSPPLAARSRLANAGKKGLRLSSTANGAWCPGAGTGPGQPAGAGGHAVRIFVGQLLNIIKDEIEHI